MVRNPSPGSHLRCDVAEALLRRSYLRTVAEGDLCSPTRGEVSEAADRPIQPNLITLYCAMPSRPNSAIKVPVMVATSFSLPSSTAKACASHTVMVRPGLRTQARNRK